MPTQPALIVFDLDGTLIDTAPDLLSSINHIVMGEGIAPINKDKIRPFVGFGGRAMLRKVYEDEGQAVSEENLDRLVAQFVAHYGAAMPGTSAPFPGLLQSLERLANAGHKFAVCTNKTEYLAKKLLQALGMTDLFQAVTGQDSFEVRKPHPDHLLKTIDMAGGNRNNAIMVGDSSTDFNTAFAAGVPIIGVEFGYSDQPLTNFDLDVVICHYDELSPEMIAKLMQSNNT